MRRTILFGILVAAIACSGDATAPPNTTPPNTVDPPDTVDPELPQFEMLGEYYLWAVGDSLICGDDGCHARTIGFYEDEYGYSTVRVGPGGLLTFYGDSVNPPSTTHAGRYWLRFTICWTDRLAFRTPCYCCGPDNNRDDGRGEHYRGQWTATGTMYDTLSFTNDRLGFSDVLQAVLRGESARRTTGTDTVWITPLYVDVHIDQPHEMAGHWPTGGSKGPYRDGGVFELMTFRREDR